MPNDGFRIALRTRLGAAGIVSDCPLSDLALEAGGETKGDQFTRLRLNVAVTYNDNGCRR